MSLAIAVDEHDSAELARPDREPYQDRMGQGVFCSPNEEDTQGGVDAFICS